MVTPHPEQESFDAEVVDAKGNCYVQLSGYKTVALPNSVDAEPLKALKAAMATACRLGDDMCGLLK